MKAIVNANVIMPDCVIGDGGILLCGDIISESVRQGIFPGHRSLG